MESPLVSVLLPVYNAQPYIVEAVESILAQTLRDFELLIHDDGSTDGSFAVLQRLAARDNRIRLTHAPNRGLVATLNAQLQAARAPLVARMDADDTAHPLRLARQVEEMNHRPTLLVLGGAIQLVDCSGEVVFHPTPVVGNEVVQHEALAGRTPICHPACMMRTSAIRSVGGYRSETWPAEDLDLFLRLGEQGELDNLSDIVLNYRLHAASISASRAQDQLDKMHVVCEEAATRRGSVSRSADHELFDELVRDALAIPGVMSNPTARALVRAGASFTHVSRKVLS